MSQIEDTLSEASRLVREIYSRVNRLEELFKSQGRKFTPDGHLVGSFGEVLAAANYALSLHSPSHPVHDAEVEAEGRQVQIKITQVSKVGIRHPPEHLLVLSLDQDGTSQEIYNGAGEPAWRSAGPMQKNGQRSIGLRRLRDLMPQGARIPRRG